MIKSGRYSLLIVFLLIMGNLYAQENTVEFTLNQLLDSALQNNFTLKSAEKNKLIKN